MNEISNLEDKLKKESNRFFAGFDYKKLSRAVFLKIKDHDEKSGKKFAIPKMGFNYRIAARVSAILACFVLLITSVIFLRGTIYKNEKNEMIGKPISQQKIDLNDTDYKEKWVTFFKINKPDKVRQGNLLAVLWETGRNGDYQMAYSSMFENSSIPEPVRTIAFNNEQPSIIILSTTNTDKQYIHYRVVGYSGSRIIAFMEQNYVTCGEIAVIDGVIKETRLVPGLIFNKKHQSDLHQMVTYYIPYQVNESGDIHTPVENLKINKGDFIAVLGNENTPVETLNSNLLIDWEQGSELLNNNINTKFFKTENTGQEDIYIKPSNEGGKGKIISILVQ
ncbi:MAG: hypothetical protein ACOYIF_01470 [Acetivibrionales bacterium]|jgi:hypothetical protein